MDENNKTPQATNDEYESEKEKKIKWVEFVETQVLDFFGGHNLE